MNDYLSEWGVGSRRFRPWLAGFILYNIYRNCNCESKGLSSGNSFIVGSVVSTKNIVKDFQRLLEESIKKTGVNEINNEHSVAAK